MKENESLSSEKTPTATPYSPIDLNDLKIEETYISCEGVIIPYDKVDFFQIKRNFTVVLNIGTRHMAIPMIGFENINLFMMKYAQFLSRKIRREL